MATTSSTDKWNWFTIAVAVISASAAISVYISRKKSKDLVERITELENALKVSQDKCAAERQGRTRAQQAVRKALTNDTSNKSKLISYPMAPIAVVQSCFATRYGTPRQPLLVPLARACLVFNTSLVPLAALEGLAEYSHCWIIYVFHLNTDLEKLWKHPSRSKFKAKVRVPKLKGGRMGVFATRSPHRPCPIGLTVAKVEAVQGNMVLLSGVDLVDGTPVLDIKPYLPYCDSIQGAAVPEWVMTDGSLGIASIKFSDEFSSTLASCWRTAEEKSLYASPDEFQTLVKQILSWDIRSLSQRIQPHNIMLQGDNKLEDGRVANSADDMDGDVSSLGSQQGPFPSTPVIYHLMLEELDVAYRIDDEGNVVVGKVVLFPNCKNRSQYPCSNAMWRNVVS